MVFDWSKKYVYYKFLELIISVKELKTSIKLTERMKFDKILNGTFYIWS